MGFRAEQIKLKRKIRRCWAVVGGVFALIMSAAILYSVFVRPASSWKYYVGLPDVEKRKEGELRVHFLDVGQGDCTLIEFPDGKTMLIDGGDGRTDTAKTVLRYLNALKIERLDFLLLTHSDSDHCGSLDEVLKYKKVGTVYAPAIDNYAINPEYASFYAALQKYSGEVVCSKRYLTVSSDDGRYPYTLVFLSPYGPDTPGSQYEAVNDGDYTDEDLNDTSAVVWLDYFGTSALFTGDATQRVEETLKWDYLLGFFDGYGVKLDSTELLKTAHHGSRYSTSEEFVRLLNVETAVVSCGTDNPYGHPSEEALANLTAVGAEIYRTDRQGTVIATAYPDGTYAVTTAKTTV